MNYKLKNADLTQTKRHILSGLYIVVFISSIIFPVIETNAIPMAKQPFKNSMDSISIEVNLKTPCFQENNGRIFITTKGGIPFNGGVSYQYQWSNGSTEAILANLSAGLYSLTITDSVGSQLDTIIELMESPQILLSHTNLKGVSCGENELEFNCDGTAEVKASYANGTTGSFDFIWSSGENEIDTDRTVAKKLCSGMQTLRINDGACQITDTFEVLTPTPFSIEAAILSPSCKVPSSGEIAIQVNGGDAPFEYDFGAGFIAENTAKNLELGAYHIIVKDSNNCQLFLDTTLTETIIDPNEISITPPSCFGFKDASIVFNIPNGLSPYRFDLNGGNTFQNVSILDSLEAGTYDIQIKDANDCLSEIIPITIETPEAIVIEVDDTQTQAESCEGSADGQLAIIATGGRGTLTYHWDSPLPNGDNGFDLPSGNYALTVTDDSGCAATKEIALTTLVSIQKKPEAVDDIFELDFQKEQELDILENDLLKDQAIITALITQPEVGIAQINESDNLTLNFTDTYEGILSFDYEICLAECPEICDVGTVIFQTKRADFCPSGFTPNGDGVNDTFVFPTIRDNAFDQWPNNEFMVFNRWGTIVYYAKPYQNDWDGTNHKSKQNLPAGTYFYILRLDLGEGIVKRGEVTILR